MRSITDRINEGVVHLQQGRPAVAAALYQRVLARAPRNADAWHLLSVARFQLGEASKAIEHARRAIAFKPDAADYHSNLSRYQLSLLDFAAAVASAERALALNPEHAAAMYNLGGSLRGAGRCEEAVAWLRKYVAAAPDDAAGHHALGEALADLHRHADAVVEFERAAALGPQAPEPRNNLGNALQALGRFREAIPHYEAALRLRPSYAEAASNLGAAWQGVGDLEEARRWYDEALRIEPGMLQARGNIANLAAARGEHEQAAAAFREILVTAPDSAETWNNLGNSLQALGRVSDALEAYRRALAVRPSYHVARNNVGNALRKLGRCQEALAEFDLALAADPAFAEAVNNRAVALQDLGRTSEAAAAFEKAISMRAGFSDPLINLANHWRDQGRPAKAAELLHQALRVDPNNGYAWNNLGAALSDEGLPAEAIDCYRRALERMPSNHQAHSNILLNLHYLPGIEPEAIHAEHIAFRRHAMPLLKLRRNATNRPDEARVLRVGYVSADFRRHSVAFFAEPLIERHDPARVECYCYSAVTRPDAVTARFEQLAGPRWRDTRGLDDEAFAHMVRADEIDILVDLGGHTANSRLLSFAARPAPVQVTYLGYPGTTGLESIDYRFTDAWADPPGQSEVWHSETLWRLEQGFLCFRPPRQSPDPAEAPVATTGRFTFGSFNNLAKISDPLLDDWAEILLRAPGSRMVIKNKALSGDEARKRVIDAFARRGVDPDRVSLSALIPSLTAHLEAYAAVDLALDTHPYNGTTTTCEALWMGAPVLTMAGRAHAGRTGVSILSLAGLPSLIANSREDYVARAAAAAANPHRLPSRAEIRGRMSRSALMREESFARQIENAYRAMWRRWLHEPRQGGNP